LDKCSKQLVFLFIWIRNKSFYEFSLIICNQLHEIIKKETYFLLFVYKTETVNAPIKSDILGFL